MRILSLHSHKGGAGKSTTALILAKKHALAGKKVCLVDLDFIGTGLIDAIVMKRDNKAFLDDYILTLDELSLDELIAYYDDIVLRKKQYRFSIILNSGRIHEEAGKKQNNKDAMLQLSSMEQRTGIISEKILKMISSLNDRGYDLCILDCPPGIAELSLSIMKLVSKRNNVKDAILLCSTTDRSHIYGTIKELNRLLNGPDKLNGKSLVLFINRDSGGKFTSINNVWNELRQDAVLRDKAPALNSNLVIENYCCMKEDLALRFFDIGSAGEVPLLEARFINHTQTALCTSLFGDPGND